MADFVDTNVLIRHLTGDPPGQAERASRFLASADRLRLTDVIVAETVYVLESFYSVPRHDVAELMRSIVSNDRMQLADRALIMRTIEVYEQHRLDFADSYLVACAERSGVGTVVSFDKQISRVGTVERIEP